MRIAQIRHLDIRVQIVGGEWRLTRTTVRLLRKAGLLPEAAAAFNEFMEAVE